MTFYEALETFRQRFETALSSSSMRVIEPLDRDWQRINNELDLYDIAIANGDSTAAEKHIHNVLAILNGVGLTVTTPVVIPLSMSIFTAPSSIGIRCQDNGVPYVTSYTDAIAVISVYVGVTDDTTNWTFTIATVSNCTAAIQNDNEIKVNSITADNGYVTVTGTKTGVDNVTARVSVFKNKEIGSLGTSFDYCESFFYDTLQKGEVYVSNGLSPTSMGPKVWYHEGTYKRFYFAYFNGNRMADGTTVTGLGQKSTVNYYDVDSRTFGVEYQLPEKYAMSVDVHNLPVVMVDDDGYVLVVKEGLDGDYLRLEEGTHDGGNGAANLSDSTASFGSMTNRMISNWTKGSSGVISSNTGTTATATMYFGTAQDWDNGDQYYISTQTISGTVHNSPIEVWRSASPEDISSFTLVHEFGRIPDYSPEQALAYPRIFKDSSGVLFAFFRNNTGGSEDVLSGAKSVDGGLNWTDLSGTSDTLTEISDLGSAGWMYHRNINCTTEQGINIMFNMRHNTSSQGYVAIYFLHSDDGLNWDNARQLAEGSGGYTHDVTSSSISKANLDTYYYIDDTESSADDGILGLDGVLDPVTDVPYIVAMRYEPSSIFGGNNRITAFYFYRYDTTGHAFERRDIFDQLRRGNDPNSNVLATYFSASLIAYGSSRLDLIVTCIKDYDDEVTGEVTLNSGTTVAGQYYRVTATSDTRFGTGVGANDIIRPTSAISLDGSNTVERVRAVPMVFTTVDDGETWVFIRDLDDKYSKISGHGNFVINRNYQDNNQLLMMYSVAKAYTNWDDLDHVSFSCRYGAKV